MNLITPEPRNASSVTIEKVKLWIAAKQRFNDLHNRMRTAQKELQMQTNSLGAYLSPPDAGPGEKFNIWYGSGILQSTILSNSTEGYQYEVVWRKEPDWKQAAEQGV